MAKWRILKEGPPETFTATGETYDDVAGDVQDHVAQLQLQDPAGTCYAATLIADG